MGSRRRMSSKQSFAYHTATTASCLAKTSTATDLQLQQYCSAFLPLEAINMSPLPDLHKMRHSESFEAISQPSTLQQTTNSMLETLRLVIVLLGVLTLAFFAYWLFSRIGFRWNRRLTLDLVPGANVYEDIHITSSSSIEVFESDISIDMIAEDVQTHSSGTEFEDLSDNGDLETIVSSASATRLSFRIDGLPNIMRGGILERRGRKDMQCDTSAYYDFDNVATGTGPPSAARESKRSVTRPTFGFSFQEITPPVGSPLWNRKIDLPRAIVPGPLTHPPQLA